jgi:hypothetical protein
MPRQGKGGINSNGTLPVSCGVRGRATHPADYRHITLLHGRTLPHPFSPRSPKHCTLIRATQDSKVSAATCIIGMRGRCSAVQAPLLSEARGM